MKIQITITNLLTTLVTKIMAGPRTIIHIEAINTAIRIDSASSNMTTIQKTSKRDTCHHIHYIKTSGTAIILPKAVLTIKP